MRGRTIGTGIVALSILTVSALGIWQIGAWAGDKPGFPEGFDAVQAAPGSHKVIFENALVRVLEVTVPPNGQTEPMHHHRWPSFFLDWDTGGKSPHIRYHQPGGVVHEQLGTNTPAHPGHWSIHWMQPEPLHAIETLDFEPVAGEPPSLRVEIKINR
jgi:hypothetical protein